MPAPRVYPGAGCISRPTLIPDGPRRSRVIRSASWITTRTAPHRSTDHAPPDPRRSGQLPEHQAAHRGLGTFAPHAELSLDLPSRLADRLAAGELDVGLIPVVEYFRAGSYTIVPGISIASRGPVLSVTLFSRVPWPEIRSVALDEGSRTSAALTRILLEKRYGIRPRIEQLPIGVAADDMTHRRGAAHRRSGDEACLPGFASPTISARSGSTGPACRSSMLSGRSARCRSARCGSGIARMQGPRLGPGRRRSPSVRPRTWASIPASAGGI